MDNAQLCQTRAITRSQGTSNTKYPVQNQLILKGWELSEIKKAQLNDQNLGFIHLCMFPRQCICIAMLPTWAMCYY
jgi:hypothetical protein